MTALSIALNFSKSTESAGIPLDGLPPLEAGRSLPDAFAKVLDKASKPGVETPVEGEFAGIGDGEAEAQLGDALPVSAKTAQVVPGAASLAAANPTAALAPGAAEGTEAATGKTLPPERSGFAGPAQADAKAMPEMPPSAIKVEAAAKPEDKAAKSEIDGEERPSAETRNAAPVSIAQASIPGSAIASSAVVGQVTAAREISARPVGVAAGQTKTLPSAASPVATANAFKAADAASQAQQDSVGADGSRRGDAQGEPAARQFSAKTQAEPAQTGLSLQLRAAERPMASADTSSSLTQGATPGTSPSGFAAPLHVVGNGVTPLGVAPQAGVQPQFPELAALVDRIAAARDSVGSATATIALAHKELGNLSLTFEATGRTLDVEVAAQDSDTQRSLAAALAADRPQLRAAEASQQAPSQSLHAQLASSANSGGGDARQSAMAGDAQSDRRDSAHSDGRNGSQGGPGSGNASTDPKSDGGIYA